ncbi:PQQ-binding-like beta-propeller repeat protein [Mariniblastus sp.]|nr:PQQ-binding-like beta-propeller repeat protein [Mariniblastus sp.]MDC3223773.1 PQQ-binding-like beta-propeller repeat protein [Mariniblastus sp.]
MTPRQLLEKLENLGIIDPKVLGKIRAEIEKSDKEVKPKSVLAFLVKKKHITEQQAKILLASTKELPKKEDDFEFVEPEPAGDKDFDTGDLTGLGKEEVVDEVDATVPEVNVAVDYDATMTLVDAGDLAEEFAVPTVNPIEIGAVVPTEVGFPQEPAFDALADDGYGSGAYQTQSGPQQTLASFKGKKDRSDQWSTKWLYVGSAILGILLIFVTVLWFVNIGQKPEDMFEAAMSSFNKQSYGDAQKKFDNYLDQHASHRDAPKARVKRIHAIIRGTYGLKNYTEVIKQSKTLLPELREQEDANSQMEELRDDLAVMLPTSLASISKRATKITDLEKMKEELVRVKDFFTLVEDPVYIPNSRRKSPSVNDNYLKIANNIATIEGQIEKEEQYELDLDRIEMLNEGKKTEEAFAVYQKLTRNYGDLASRSRIRELMLKISETEKALVKHVELPEVKVAEVPRSGAVEQTVVLSVTSGKPVPALKDEVVAFLAEGSVYGIDAGQGIVKWRRFVGYETTNQPEVTTDEKVFVSDQRNNDLLQLDLQSGELIWRVEIQEPFLAPSVTDKAVILNTESGKLLQLDRATGELMHSIQLPQPVNVSAMLADRDPYLYQVGSYQNLYVISSQTLDCVEVFSLGHYEGSISTPPQTWTGHILLVVNLGGQSDLYVLKPRDKGMALELVQVIPGIVSGTVSTPMKRFGRWMLMTSDTGELRILELYPEEEKNPVNVLTQDVFDAKGSERVFVTTEGSNLWVAGKGIMRYRVPRNLAQFDRIVNVDSGDTFLAPVSKLDDYLFHIKKRNQSGMVSASLVDAMELKTVWRTDFGGGLAGSPILYNDDVIAVNNQGDTFPINDTVVNSGVALPSLRASKIRSDLQFETLVELPDNKFACFGAEGRKDMLLVDLVKSKSRVLSLVKPADQIASPPIALGSDVIVPTLTGQVARINPNSGAMQGTPFQPALRPNGSTPRWFEPARLDENQLVIARGQVDKDMPSVIYTLTGSNPRSIKKTGELVCESPVKSNVVLSGSQLFGVLETPDGDKLTSFTSQPLANVKDAALDSDFVSGPWATEAGILVATSNGKLHCYQMDLSLKWSAEVPDVKFACGPEITANTNGRLMLCFQNGNVVWLDPETGKLVSQIDLGQPINHRPLLKGGKMYFGGLDGTIHIVDQPK